ncbi:MAG: transcriptional regulator [Flavobacterium sp.]|uniref:transcriptional regulator n=1 Tax=Flavobacterium sp. TaxID=239 RepID=UPI0025C008D8|nr:transcriptional regulator [Flavobacterium sp.]MBA4135187.1 transcriptional regulator [Flavobacterium sp.]
MNYIKHLTGFFDKVANDRQLNPTHVSLYMSLFQFWNYNRFKNPISISRDEIMRISKISSKATYHKCLKALHAQGYIKYEPSYNPFKGSHVFLFNFSDDLKPLPKNTSSNFKPVDEQVVNKLQTSDETSPELVDEQVVVPYINNTNNTNDLNILNSVNLGESEKKIEDVKFSFINQEVDPKEKSSGQKEKVIPELKDVLNYFQEHSFPELEANKFFNYFKSIGWLVGGKTPMANWHAAANNWMLNAEKFSIKSGQNLSVSDNKNYAEPL